MSIKIKVQRTIFIVVFWTLIWYFLHLIIDQNLYMPSPLAVFSRLSELVFLSTFWLGVFASIYRVAIGVTLSVLLGVILGVLSGSRKIFYDFLNPLVISIKSTPVLSFIIIALIWFSSSNVPIFICLLMCFPIIWTNVVEGIKNVDIKLLEMAKVYKVSKINIIKKIYIPCVKPFVFASLITSMGLGWKVTVASEVLSYPKHAIGSNLYSSKVYLDSEQLFAWTIVVIILSIIFEIIFKKLINNNSRIRS